MTHFAGTGLARRKGGVDERVEVVVERVGAIVIAGDKCVVELGDRLRGEVPDAAEVPAAAEHEHRVAQQLDPREGDEVACRIR